jgi:hypothetical protein
MTEVGGMTEAEMSRKEIATCKRAAKRWGKSDPSFDDVISELTPTYRTDRGATAIDVARWQRLKNYAMSLVEATSCVVCGKPVANPKVNVTCSPRCAGQHRMTVYGNPGAGKPRKPLTNAMVQDIVRMYKAGGTVSGVARELGIGYKRVRKVLHEKNVPVDRKRGRMSVAGGTIKKEK